MNLRSACCAVAVALGVSPAGAALAQQSFWAFESGHVRPLALSADRGRLYAVNTPDNRLETFAVSDAGLSHLGSTPVGLEPVAVCLEPSGTRAWVVNHLSDDVSVVDLASVPPRVVRTLLVGDEPMDCVAASGRMFVSTARRGQNTNIDPALLTPSVSRTPGRALVWVFDPGSLGTSLAGTPIEIVGDGAWAAGDSIFGDAPRPLAVSPDGSRVYVGIFHSGNRSSAILETVATGAAGFVGADTPATNFEGIARPAAGAVVQQGPGGWTDGIGRNFTSFMRHSQPDLDVFEIDAANPIPSGVRVLQSFAGVGTILFNIAVHPIDGTLYVSNTEANNRERFEGPGTFCATQTPACTSLRGHLHEARITLINPGTAAVTPRHLNKHLVPYTPATDTPADSARSLATPLGMALNPAGTRLYVAAFGSSKIGVFDTAALASNAFTPDASTHIPLSVGGPSGLVLDESPSRRRIYVATRFGNSLAVVDTSTFPGTEIAVVPFPHDPEPQIVRDGRRFLYDARATSSNGEASCSSCHVFGNFDSLGWNLGNPDGTQAPNPNPFVADTPDPGGAPRFFHPMKGPMTTQSLRGMANHGPMHWRGDRTGGSIGGDPLSHFEAFMAFRVAFEGLLGRATQATDEEMIAFTNFILEVRYPPNPYRALSNADVTHGWPTNPTGTDLSQGREIYFGQSDADGPGGAPADGADGVNGAPFFNNGAGRPCNHCHTLDEPNGFFGSEGLTTFEGEPQHAKVAHLRNVYAKTGFFGIACIGVLPAGPGCSGANFGDQVKGFGVLHDGAIATVLDFVGAPAFTYQGTSAEQAQKRRALAEFVLGFPSNLRPIVGQQITLDATNGGVVGQRIQLLIDRALAGDCEVVVKGRVGGEPRGWVMSAADVFDSDLATEAPLTDAALRALAATAGQELTYTCAPPGSGPRIGINRDDDMVLDAQECGDVNADGVPARGDADAMRRALAGLTPLGVAAKCNAIGPLDMADGDLDGVPNDCNAADVAVVRRASNVPALGPGPLQVCQRSL